MEDFEKELGELGDLELGDLDDINLDDIDELQAVEPPAAEAIEGKPTIIQDALGGVTTYVDIVFCSDFAYECSAVNFVVQEVSFESICDATHFEAVDYFTF